MVYHCEIIRPYSHRMEQKDLHQTDYFITIGDIYEWLSATLLIKLLTQVGFSPVLHKFIAVYEGYQKS